MAEIVDFFLVGWCVLALGVYILGYILERQIGARVAVGSEGTQSSRRPNTTNLDDFWSPSARVGSSSGYHDPYPSYRRSNDYGTGFNNASSAYGDSSLHSSALGRAAAASSHYNDPLYPSLGAQNATSSLAYGQSTSSGYHQLKSNSYQPQPNSDASPSASYNYDDRFGDDLATSHQSQANQFATFTASTIPTATGYNSDCIEWVNNILYLLFTRPEKYGPIIGENVCRSLNEKLTHITSSSDDYANLLIEFEGINMELSSRPELTNVRTESESDKSISATCKIYNEQIVFNLLIKRLMVGDQDEQVARYDLVLENLEGKLKSMVMLNDKLIVIQFIEKPDTKILLRPVVTLQQLQSGTHSNELINEDVLVQMIIQTITQVVVDLYFGNDLEFPQYKHHHQSAYSSYKNKFNNILKGSAFELKRSLKHDLFGTPSPSGQLKEQRISVKLIKAKNINFNQNVTCLMELDAPKQQAISSTKQGSSPVWDEQFLFSVNEKSQELTLELWDSLNLAAVSWPEGEQTAYSSLGRRSNKRARADAANTATAARWNEADLTSGPAKFLGFAHVAIEELRQNPVQKLNLSLEPALGIPKELSNSVAGELQLELMLLEHTTGGTSPSANKLQKSNSLSSLARKRGEIVSVDRKLTPSGYVITTTTITKQPPTPAQQLRQKFDQLLQPQRTQSPAGSSSMATEEQSLDELRDSDAVSASNSAAVDAPVQEEADQGRRSRSRSRSKSFLEAIKERFGLSRMRSRSVGESLATLGRRAERPGSGLTGSERDFESGVGGGGSRSRASSDVSVSARAKSMPASSREPSEVPTIVINKDRMSDTASALAFTRPKSQLVIEVLEPTLREDGNGNNKTKGIYRYYAIADTASNKRKWRKRGTKLHLFNDHQFVAAHLASSNLCHLCGRVFSRRPGKQGYKCRNCHLLLHKQCHVKVDHNCPYVAHDSLQLEYVDVDPPSSSSYDARDHRQSWPAENLSEPTLVGMNAAQADPYGPAPGRLNRRMVPKSLSMEADER